MTTSWRRIAMRVLFVTMVGVVTCAAAENPPAPVLEAVGDAYDAGRVVAGTKVTHTYRLRNHGTQPLTLTVEPSCGCTTTAFDKVIPAGGEGGVTAALVTDHFRGHTVKSVRVTTDDRDQPALTLTLAVDVVPIIAVKPAEQPVLTAPVGALQPMQVTLTAPDGVPFAITHVEDDPQLAVRLAARGTSAVHELTLTPKADLPIGTHMPVVKLTTTRAQAEHFELHPMIIVEGPLAVKPMQLQLRSASKPMTVRIWAAKKGAPFRVLKAESSDPDFTPSVAAAGLGATYDVTLSYTGNPERHGPVNGVLKVTTDEPRQPLLIVRFSGQL